MSLLDQPSLQRAAAAPEATDDLASVIQSGADMTRVQDRKLLRALQWWQALPRPAGSLLPDRSQIDPLSIPDLLPHLVLWEVMRAADGSFNYRCRLAGTAMVEIHGYEFTGQAMEDFHGADNSRIQPEYDFVSRTGQPHHVERSLFWMNRDYRRYRRLLLPFGHRPEDRGVAKIMNVAHFLNE